MNPSRTPFRAESIGWMGVEDEGRGTVDGLTFKARNGTDAKNVLFALLKKVCFWVVTVFYTPLDFGRWYTTAITFLL